MIMQCRIPSTVKGFRIGIINVAILNEINECMGWRMINTLGLRETKWKQMKAMKCYIKETEFGGMVKKKKEVK
jgi:hypothetical protein